MGRACAGDAVDCDNAAIALLALGVTELAPGTDTVARPSLQSTHMRAHDLAQLHVRSFDPYECPLESVAPSSCRPLLDTRAIRETSTWDRVYRGTGKHRTKGRLPLASADNL
jgi:hypothetical protein